MGEPTFRLATTEDGDACAAVYGPYVTDTIISFEAVPPSGQEMSRRIAAALEKHCWLVCEIDGEVVGYGYTSAHKVRDAYRWSVDFGVYLKASACGKGIGIRLYGLLKAISRSQGYRSAFGGVTLPNEASVRLHESAGFQAIGVYPNVGYKLGAWRDVGWWGIDLQPALDPPLEPITVQDVPGLDAILSGG